MATSAQKGKMLAGLKAQASALMARMSLGGRLGQQFGGKRKLYEVFGYPNNLTFADLYGKYKRQDLASRIVNMPPEQLWAAKPALEKPEGAKQKWEDFVAKTSLWERIVQADKLLSFGRFSVLWLGLPGDVTSPARVVRSADDFLYLQAYGGDAVRVKTYEDSTSSRRFGKPVMYEVDVGPEEQRQTKQVHYSRLIHLVDTPLQGQIFGEPRLEQIYNVLDDILKTGGGSAETYWLTANRGMQVDIDKDMEMDTDDADALAAELDEFQHNLRRYIRTRGVKVNALGSEVADPRGVFEVSMAILAGTTSIPQRILTGSEAGQLASEQDRANWAEYIERRRTVFAEPYVLKPILQRLGELNYLDVNDWQKAEFKWPEAFHLSPLEKSTTQANSARAAVNLSRRNQFGNPLISDEEAREMVGLPREADSGDTFPPPPPAKGTGKIGATDGSGSNPSTAGTPSVTDAPSAIS